ncbi:hypothetical protein Moror_10936 [Moniliophthora roreri MCA 2997]|uniref:Uncharacterized protein n=1 Tax=Moniliophthora roreri (strain MCA 2997) TaxID=1381753 RepID=V2Y4W8_MONRO|nr:hypothetical protein Moror_10936 [Moniliophthora roreri MCA 2997]
MKAMQGRRSNVVEMGHVGKTGDTAVGGQSEVDNGDSHKDSIGGGLDGGDIGSETERFAIDVAGLRGWGRVDIEYSDSDASSESGEGADCINPDDGLASFSPLVSSKAVSSASAAWVAPRFLGVS